MVNAQKSKPAMGDGGGDRVSGGRANERVRKYRAAESSRAKGGAPVALCGIFSGTRSGSTKSATSLIRLPREDALSASWCLYANVPGSSSVEASEEDGVV